MKSKVVKNPLADRYQYLRGEINRDFPQIINVCNDLPSKIFDIYRFTVHKIVWKRIETSTRKLFIYVLFGEQPYEKIYLAFLELNNESILLKVLRDSKFDSELSDLLIKCLIQRMSKLKPVKSCL